MKRQLRFIGILTFVVTLFIGCDGQFDKVPETRFIGDWELIGRSVFDGITIKIELENDKLIGRISKLNENKYVKMFSEINDIWISEISRTSKFQFSLTEKKIGGQLFSLYGLSTSNGFKVEFIDDNTFGLGTKSQDPSKSKVIYKRVIK